MKNAWLKDIKGMWVATYQEGRMIGVVNNIYIDAEKKQVNGFALRTGSVLGGQDVWIEHEHIKKFGLDLILIPSLDHITQHQLKGRRADQLVGMQVFGKNGSVLGHVSDISVNLETWEINEFSLNNDKLVKINLNETVLGKDLILVQADAAALEKAKEKKSSLMESVFGKDFVKHTSDVLKRVLKGSESAATQQPPEPVDQSEPEDKQDASPQNDET